MRKQHFLEAATALNDIFEHSEIIYDFKNDDLLLQVIFSNEQNDTSTKMLLLSSWISQVSDSFLHSVMNFYLFKFHVNQPIAAMIIIKLLRQYSEGGSSKVKRPYPASFANGIERMVKYSNEQFSGEDNSLTQLEFRWVRGLYSSFISGRGDLKSFFTNSSTGSSFRILQGALTLSEKCPPQGDIARVTSSSQSDFISDWLLFVNLRNCPPGCSCTTNPFCNLF